MTRKIITIALIVMLGGLTVKAETIMNTALDADGDVTLVASAGQTFTTGTLLTNGLTQISIRGPLGDSTATEYYLVVYENNGSPANDWDPGAFVAVSTNSAAIPTSATAIWGFSNELLTSNTVYLFTFSSVPTGADFVGARVGTTSGDTYAGGTMFSDFTEDAEGADIAAKISTGPVVPDPEPELTEPEPGTIWTTYGTVVSGENDANQAGPMFGQGITINVGASTNNAAIPQIVFLQEVTFQNSSSGGGASTAISYLHVYDDWGVDGSANPTTIGNLMAVSTNTVDLSVVAASDALTWKFAFDELDKETVYHYVVATDTNAATVGDSANLSPSGYELNVGNPYSGGDAWRANGIGLDWDMEFRVISSLAGDAPAAAVTNLVITGPIGEGMILSWTGEAGKSYGVETKSNLITGDWQTFTTGVESVGTTINITTPIASNQLFYRVISE